MARAISSLPVPLSPRTRIVARLAAARAAVLMASDIFAFAVSRPARRYRDASCSFSSAFSETSARRSSVRVTSTSSSSRSMGLVR